MEKNIDKNSEDIRKRFKKITISAVVFVLILNFLIVTFYFISGSSSSRKILQKTNVEQSEKKIEKISYKGEEGKTAEEILIEKHSIDKNNSGLIVAIDGVVARDSEKEYWAFYVNGKIAEVGPKDYKTKSKDLVEWKIERF